MEATRVLISVYLATTHGITVHSVNAVFDQKCRYMSSFRTYVARPFGLGAPMGNTVKSGATNSTAFTDTTASIRLGVWL